MYVSISWPTAPILVNSFRTQTGLHKVFILCSWWPTVHQYSPRGLTGTGSAFKNASLVVYLLSIPKSYKGIRFVTRFHFLTCDKIYMSLCYVIRKCSNEIIPRTLRETESVNIHTVMALYNIVSQKTTLPWIPPDCSFWVRYLQVASKGDGRCIRSCLPQCLMYTCRLYCSSQEQKIYVTPQPIQTFWLT